MKQRTDFYPRPPRGGRPFRYGRIFWAIQFLSTPSARRATSGAVTIAAVAGFLSTPSARRATLYNLDPRPGRMDFYPRPPRGGRRASTARRLSFMQFLSTPSARRATRTSCTRSLPMRFLSTPSARRATYRYATYKATAIFLSTPSARRATRASSSRRCHSMYFYPRPPRGGRPAPYAAIRWLEDISIHALREEGD